MARRSVPFPQHRQTRIIGAPESTPQERYIAALRAVCGSEGLQAACERHADTMTTQVNEMLTRAWGVSLWAYEVSLREAVRDLPQMQGDYSLVEAVQGSVSQGDKQVLKDAYGKFRECLSDAVDRLTERAEVEYFERIDEFGERFIAPIITVLRECE